MQGIVYMPGKIGYKHALYAQERAADLVASNTHPRLFLCQHPDVITIGRDTLPEDRKCSNRALRRQGFEVYNVERCGKSTYHGPGMMMVYFVSTIEKGQARAHIELLQQTIIDFMESYGIHSFGSDDPNHPGVLTSVRGENRKIAAIGVDFPKIDGKRVSQHGAAIYVDPTLECFNAIHPCGDRYAQPTSMEEKLHQNFIMRLVMERYLDIFSRATNTDFSRHDIEELNLERIVQSFISSSSPHHSYTDYTELSPAA